jgi:hypothetical protein
MGKKYKKTKDDWFEEVHGNLGFCNGMELAKKLDRKTVKSNLIFIP